jgi:hypothetical protein
MGTGVVSRGVMLTTGFHLVARLKISAAMPPLLPYAFMSLTGRILPSTTRTRTRSRRSRRRRRRRRMRRKMRRRMRMRRRRRRRRRRRVIFSYIPYIYIYMCVRFALFPSFSTLFIRAVYKIRKATISPVTCVRSSVCPF